MVITFSIGDRQLEANYKFWVNVSVHIHVPDKVMLWTLNIINPIIILFSTSKVLRVITTKRLHIPHYYAAQNHVPHTIIVNITVSSTVNNIFHMCLDKTIKQMNYKVKQK